MELVLNKEDIENLINENYSGISELEFEPEEIKIKIKMSLNSFLKKKTTSTTANAQDLTTTAEKPVKKPKNVMSAGGRDRAMMRVG